MDRKHSSSHSGKKKSKKQRQPAADRDTLFQMVNQLRATFNLPEIKTQEIFDQYAMNIFSGSGIDFDANNAVLLSEYHFFEYFDEKSSSQQLIQKWLNDSSKRPVLFAPGNKGTISFVETEEGKYIVMLVLSIFH